jgi:hypothetical protein
MKLRTFRLPGDRTAVLGPGFLVVDTAAHIELYGKPDAIDRLRGEPYMWLVSAFRVFLNTASVFQIEAELNNWVTGKSGRPAMLRFSRHGELLEVWRSEGAAGTWRIIRRDLLAGATSQVLS